MKKTANGTSPGLAFARRKTRRKRPVRRVRVGEAQRAHHQRRRRGAVRAARRRVSEGVVAAGDCLAAYGVRERSLHHRPQVIRPLGRPVPERRPEAMRNCPDPQLLEQLREPRIGELLAGRAGKDQPGGLRRRRACAQALGRMQDLYRAGAQRYPVLASRLHPRRRDRPRRLAEVDLLPPRAPRFPGSDRRQHQNLERRLDTARPEPDARTVSMAAATPLWGRASRCVTMSFCGCRSADRAAQHAVAGIVVSQVHRNDPPQHAPDALVHRAGRLRLHVPGGRLDLQHVGGVDLRDQPPGRHGGRHSVRGWDPVLRIPPVARAPTLLFEHALAVLGESRNARRAALLRKRVASGPRQLPVGEVCSRAAASETSPAAPTDGIERGRSRCWSST